MPEFLKDSPEAIRSFLILKWMFIGLDLLLSAALFYLLRQLWRHRPPLYLDLEPKKKIFTLGEALIKERWERILKKASQGSKENLTLAVIEADKLVDDILKNLGLEGEHMADRLGQISSDEVSSFDRVWRAHRLRNELVHSPHYELALGEAERALDDFESFLKEVKAIS